MIDNIIEQSNKDIKQGLNTVNKYMHRNGINANLNKIFGNFSKVNELKLMNDALKKIKDTQTTGGLFK